MGVHVEAGVLDSGRSGLMFVVSVLNYQALLERVPLLYSSLSLRWWR